MLKVKECFFYLIWCYNKHFFSPSFRASLIFDQESSSSISSSKISIWFSSFFRRKYVPMLSLPLTPLSLSFHFSFCPSNGFGFVDYLSAKSGEEDLSDIVLCFFSVGTLCSAALRGFLLPASSPSLTADFFPSLAADPDFFLCGLSVSDPRVFFTGLFPGPAVSLLLGCVSVCSETFRFLRCDFLRVLCLGSGGSILAR